MEKKDRDLKQWTFLVYAAAVSLLLAVDITLLSILPASTARSLALVSANLAIFLGAFALAGRRASRSRRKIEGLSKELLGKISDLEEANEAMHDMIHYDELTRLKNRFAFNEDVAEWIADKRPFTIFLIDIEGFKNVNGMYGHNYGDFFLINLAKKLSRQFSRERVYRWTGGHFILLVDTADASAYEEILDRIHSTTRKEWLLNGLVFRAKLAIGVSRHPEDGSDVNELFKKADMALNMAKETGIGKTVVFDDQLTRDVEFRYVFEKVLTEAMEQERLQLMFQPIVDAVDFTIRGFEVLTRWQDNPFGLGIGEIIAMAEKTDLIIRVDQYVVEQAFKCVQKEPRFEDVFLSLNLSARSFRLEHLADWMRERKEAYGINPHKVHLELTEYTLVSDIGISRAIMDDLRAAGYDLSLDDFGTGFSSLNYLNKLPFKVLKVDKSYVDNVLTDQRNRIIVEDLVQLTRKLDMETIAEGVEDREQVALLQKIGCTYFQGYCFSGPLTLEETLATPNDAFCGIH